MAILLSVKQAILIGISIHRLAGTLPCPLLVRSVWSGDSRVRRAKGSGKSSMLAAGGQPVATGPVSIYITCPFAVIASDVS